MDGVRDTRYTRERKRVEAYVLDYLSSGESDPVSLMKVVASEAETGIDEVRQAVWNLITTQRIVLMDNLHLELAKK